MRMAKKHPDPLRSKKNRFILLVNGRVEVPGPDRYRRGHPLLGELIGAHPQESRWKLSQKLCEAWQWKQANGALARHGVPRPAADAATVPARSSCRRCAAIVRPIRWTERARPAAGADRHHADDEAAGALGSRSSFNRCGAPPTSRCSTA